MEVKPTAVVALAEWEPFLAQVLPPAPPSEEEQHKLLPVFRKAYNEDPEWRAMIDNNRWNSARYDALLAAGAPEAVLAAFIRRCKGEPEPVVQDTISSVPTGGPVAQTSSNVVVYENLSTGES